MVTADNSPTQSHAMGYHFGTGGTSISATWSKGHAFYFNMGIVAFNSSSPTGARKHDSGIGGGIVRGVFNG